MILIVGTWVTFSRHESVKTQNITWTKMRPLSLVVIETFS
jgi:hypothetical protein